MNIVGNELQAEGLTFHEASIISGIGRTKLYEAIAKKELKARTFGARTLILRDDLGGFLKSRPEVQ